MAVVLYEAIFVNSFPVASMGGAILPRTITVLLALHTLTRTLEIRLTELLEKSRAKVILRFRKKKKKKLFVGGVDLKSWSEVVCHEFENESNNGPVEKNKSVKKSRGAPQENPRDSSHQ